MTVPKKRYWTAHFDVDPEAAALSRVVAKSHSPRFQTYTKERLLSILDDKDSKKNLNQANESEIRIFERFLVEKGWVEN